MEQLKRPRGVMFPECLPQSANREPVWWRRCRVLQVSCSRKRSDGKAAPLICMSSRCLFHLSIKRPDADLHATLAKVERKRKKGEKRIHIYASSCTVAQCTCAPAWVCSQKCMRDLNGIINIIVAVWKKTDVWSIDLYCSIKQTKHKAWPKSHIYYWWTVLLGKCNYFNMCATNYWLFQI